MKVSPSTEGPRSEKGPSKVTKKKAKPNEASDEPKEAKKAEATPKKNEASRPSPDAKVELSSKARDEKSREEAELKAAEKLMDHIDAGKLSEEEKGLALKRIGETLKKYGRA